MSKNRLCIDDELIILPYQKGVKLIPAKKLSNMTQHVLVADLMKMPFMVYFFEKNSKTRRINEATADAFNILSMKDALDKTVSAFVQKECAEISIANNTRVIHSEHYIIKDESYVRRDQQKIETLSFKFPLYDMDNRLSGVFGYTFLNDPKAKISLSNCFTELAATGLFPCNNSSLENKIKNPLFSKKEQDVLFHLSQGKTAKEIAVQLHLSFRTVEYYLSNMKTKANCRSKSELLEKILL